MQLEGSMKERLLFLDIFRGLCVIGMMVVDWPGSWDTRFAIFNHAQWMGVTAPDFIFPSFMFIMGVAIPYSLQAKKDAGIPPSSLYAGILRRALLLFLLGYLQNICELWDLSPGLFSHMRIPGVLQRFAVVYPIVAILYLKLPIRKLIAIIIGILLAYWGMLSLIHVPGFGAPNLAQYPQGETTPNIAAWLDKVCFGHLCYEYPFDPEGILSNFPAIATSLIGVITGLWLRRTEIPKAERINRVFVWGVLLVILGYFWGMSFPLCKKLWSSSFVLFMGGWALLFLGSLCWAIDLKGKTNRFLAIPRWYGMNAIAGLMVFSVIDFSMRVMPLGRKPNQSVYSLKDFLNDHLFRSWLSDNNASWVYSVVAILLLSLLFRWFDKRKWYLKV